MTMEQSLDSATSVTSDEQTSVECFDVEGALQDLWNAFETTSADDPGTNELAKKIWTAVKNSSTKAATDIESCMTAAYSDP